jgi:hypothetical protein
VADARDRGARSQRGGLIGPPCRLATGAVPARSTAPGAVLHSPVSPAGRREEPPESPNHDGLNPPDHLDNPLDAYHPTTPIRHPTTPPESTSPRAAPNDDDDPHDV